MSRAPPSLLYLTIYNPTLRPAAKEAEGDEDAEEQAHILFYTARERVVTRDKMLRQVGLAKALVNFTNIFNVGAPCENVHSQSRRMVMISPEPNFWIHACLEVAKTTRSATTSPKPSKSKGKEPAAKPVVVYHDGSVRELALRNHILHGYEMFKITHGSFASILSSLGQQALELQLERFFTVWAWKWDVEEDSDFSSHLGTPMHPLHRSLTPILDEISETIPSCITAFALLSPHVVPSSRLLELGYGSALIKYILSRLPPPDPPPCIDGEPPTAIAAPAESGQSLSAPVDAPSASSNKSTDHSKSILQNMSGAMLNMDMRNLKWNWPGYLTFGKGKSGSPSPTPLDPGTFTPPDAPQKPESRGEAEPKDLDVKLTPPVDTESLREAISSDYSHSPRAFASNVDQPIPSEPPVGEDQGNGIGYTASVEIASVEETDLGHNRGEAPLPETQPRTAGESLCQSEGEDVGADNTEEKSEKPTSVQLTHPLSFLPTTVFLPDGDDLARTSRKKVLHTTKGSITLAVVVDTDYIPGAALSDAVTDLFHQIEEVIESEGNKTLEMSLPNVTKILEPQDKHAVSVGSFTAVSRGGFSSQSEHLYNIQQLLHSDMDVQEVFSRGSNPQHWHIGRRGIGNKENGIVEEGVYMEIARKESTLGDADNALAGVVRRFIE